MDGAAKAAILRRYFENNHAPSDQEFGQQAVQAYLDARGSLDEEELDELEGKKGVWRSTKGGRHIFIPSDGSPSIGNPAVAAKLKKHSWKKPSSDEEMEEIERVAKESDLHEGASEKKHQNPDWVRRCVASVVHKGDDKKAAPGGTDRDAASRAFAICHSQYKKLSPAQKGSAKDDEKKWGNRAKQYSNILKAARKKKVEEAAVTEAECRWVTIGAQPVSVMTKKGPKTKREGGTPVCIDGDGVIQKGPEKMLGNSASAPLMTMDTTGNEKDAEGKKAAGNKAPEGWTGPYYGSKSALDQHKTYGSSLSFKEFEEALVETNVGFDGPPNVKGISKYDKRTLADIANAFNAIQKTFGGVLKLKSIEAQRKKGAFASAYVSDSMSLKQLFLSSKYFKDYDHFVTTKEIQANYSPNFSLSETPAHTVIHEAGHLLDETGITGPFRKFLQDADWHVSKYAKKDKKEQLAEAFLSLMKTPHDEYDDMQKKAWNALIEGITDEDALKTRNKRIETYVGHQKAKAAAEKAGMKPKIDARLKQEFGKKAMKAIMKPILPSGEVRNLSPEELNSFMDALRDHVAMVDLVKKHKKKIYGLKSYTNSSAWELKKFLTKVISFGKAPDDLEADMLAQRKKLEALIASMA